MRLRVPGPDTVLGWIRVIGTAAALGTVGTLVTDAVHDPAMTLIVPDTEVPDGGWSV
ncbi:hypothetical protein [Streptomyces sp. NPDC088757]|uniref:hypothetical protein n=1 Tax=Streptomyces sp. NPDC088757 TaxID=3365889 RepID=UPI00381DCCCC